MTSFVNPASPAQSPAAEASPNAIHDQVAALAYTLYLARGCSDGHDLDDWLRAERIILEQAPARSSLPTNGKASASSGEGIEALPRILLNISPEELQRRALAKLERRLNPPRARRARKTERATVASRDTRLG
jgi:hypothetical protein